jgi:hypothetical protein
LIGRLWYIPAVFSDTVFSLCFHYPQEKFGTRFTNIMTGISDLLLGKEIAKV